MQLALSKGYKTSKKHAQEKYNILTTTVKDYGISLFICFYMSPKFSI